MKKITSAAAAVQASITRQQQQKVAEPSAKPAAPQQRIQTADKTKGSRAGRPKLYDEKMTRVNFKIPAAFMQDVKCLANVEGMSMTQLFLSVFCEAIEKHKTEIQALKAMRENK